MQTGTALARSGDALTLGETLYRSPRTVVRRGLRGDMPVILKMVATDALNGAGLAGLRREFELNRSLTGARVSAALEFDETLGAILFEDRGCIALRDLLKGPPLALATRLRIALHAAEAVASIHAEGIVHRDINPGNLVVGNHEHDCAVYVIDLGCALLPPGRDRMSLLFGEADTTLTGTLAYLSPEQTGRVNRHVDHRTDLYALGITLYELFTGGPPFTQSDPLELIHAHIAATPPTLKALNPRLPAALSAVVAKLLEKQPEERYQSARAVADDLREIARHGNVLHFRPGRTDAPRQLVRPQRQYGRDLELEQLVDRIERVGTGDVHIVEISGAAGSGKHALADALLRHARDADFLTARISAEPLRASTGPILLLALLRRVVQQALARQGAPCEQFLARVSSLPPEHHGILSQHVPELASRLTATAPSPHGTRESSAAQDVHARAATALLAAALPLGICAIIESADTLPEAPVRWLLDTAIASRRLLIVLCQSLPDPLLSQEPRFAARTTRIGLGPIGRGDVRRLLADMLSLGEMHVRELALVLHEKSGGNPGQLAALIQELNHIELIRYDEQAGGWRYELDGIKAHYFSNTSGAHLRARIGAMPEWTRSALALTAAWGDDLPVALLEAVFAWSSAQALDALRPAVRDGLLQANITDASATSRYRFTHARVRHQVYALLTPERRRELHWQLADYLEGHQNTLATSGGWDAGTRLADQLNAALDPVTAPPPQRARAARANLLAAQESATQNAWQTCYRYARAGLALSLEEDQSRTPQKAQLLELAASAAFRCADFEQLERVLSEAPQDQLALRELAVRAAAAQTDPGAAWQHALPALAHLPLADSNPRRPSRWPFAGRRNRYARSRLTRRLPDAHGRLEEPLASAVNIAAHALDAAYRSAHPGGPGLTLQLLALAQSKGFAPGHAVAAARLAIDAQSDGDDRSAAGAAALAEQLINAFPDSLFADRAQALLTGMVAPWLAPTLDPLLEALGNIRKQAEARFDVECVRLCIELGSTLGLLRGIGLPVLERSLAAENGDFRLADMTTGARAMASLANIPSTGGLGQGKALEHCIARLTGRTNVDFSSQAPCAGGDWAAYAHDQVLCLYTDLLLRDLTTAERRRAAVRSALPTLRGSLLSVLFDWCDALVALQRLTESQTPGKSNSRRVNRTLSAVRRRAERIAALNIPAFEAKLLVLRADIAWHEGASSDALALFEQAAARARSLGFAHDEAFALELAAGYAEVSRRPDVARGFAAGAHRAWLRWGAHTRTSALEQAYPDYLSTRCHREPPSSLRGAGVSMQTLPLLTDVIDLTQDRVTLDQPLLESQTILRAAQALSGEIVLDALLQRLLGLALEHAGAQRACMLLAREGRLFVEAIASANEDSATILSQPVPLEDHDAVPESIILFAARTQQPLVLEDATQSDVFTQDPYVARERPLSVMALPILHRAGLSGVLYLEHRALDAVFTPARVSMLTLLASQGAISIENARLYADLQSTRDEYQTLYDNALEGLFRITSNGRLINANPTLARILDFDTVSELMASYRDLLPSVFLSRERLGVFFSTLDERGVVTDFDTEGVTRTGRTVWLTVTARFSRNADGSETIEGSLVDISERIARDQADKQREIAEAATVAKSAFLATMSHEIRTPMNAVLGFSKLALATRLDDRQHGYVTSIRDSAENLLRLINDILDFSKIEAGKIAIEAQPFRLASVLEDVRSLFSIDVRSKQLGFHVIDRSGDHQAFPRDGVVVGDAMRLRQVLVNLVGNAVKFTSVGRVDVDVETLGKRLCADGTEGLEVVVAVSDTGIGIAPEHRERLFESFEQAEPSITRRFGGTGLGLTICRRLVEEMGGAIDVTSAPDQGSTFRFTIVVGIPNVPSTVTDAPKRHERNASALERRRILVVEDNPINQQLAIEFLSRAGASVDVAENGREGIGRATASNFDAILMDIHMPIMDGLEATRQLRASGCELPIVAVSADALAAHRAAALQAGCNAYVTKPIDFDVLLGELNRLLPPRIAQPRRRASDRATDDDTAPTSDESTAAKASASDIEGLERLPGIDIAAAIKGHNGNVRLLLKLMGDFGKYYGDAGPRIRRMVTEGAFEEAERLAHNLHGVAGSFGARRLQGASKTLEIALAGDDHGHLLGLVQNFEVALREVLESADALAHERVALRASDRAQR
ncbi:MAG: ATP-binding protein [Pseudomonadales bacterium]